MLVETKEVVDVFARFLTLEDSVADVLCGLEVIEGILGVSWADQSLC